MDQIRLRHSVTATAVTLYLLPILFLNLSFLFYPNWSFFLTAIGLLLACIGTVILIVKMWQWEGVLKKNALPKVEYFAKPSQPLPKPEELSQPNTLNKIHEMEETLQQLENAKQGIWLRLQEKETLLTQEMEGKAVLKKQFDHMQEEFQLFKESSRNQLKQKDDAIQEYQQAISELRGSMDKKQQQIGKLESSVHDLTYEMKTLLQLNEQPVAPTPKTPIKQATQKSTHSSFRKEQEPIAVQTTLPFIEKTTPTQKSASLQLKRCLDIAQKMTGAGHIGISSKFRDIPIDNYALDQRRLFDHLRAESANLVFVYSQREDKILFANPAVKTLFGWSPEKFSQDFPQLIQDGFDDWKRAVSSLAMTREAQIPLVIKTRSGEDKFIQCQIGIVSSGVFRNHVIGILFEP